MSIYPRQPGPLGGALPGLGSGHWVLPALPGRGLSWLLQLQLVPEGVRYVPRPSRELLITAGLKSRPRRGAMVKMYAALLPEVFLVR